MYMYMYMYVYVPLYIHVFICVYLPSRSIDALSVNTRTYIIDQKLAGAEYSVPAQSVPSKKKCHLCIGHCAHTFPSRI